MQDDEFLRSELHQIQHRDRSSHVSGAVADVPRTPAGNGEHDSRGGRGACWVVVVVGSKMLKKTERLTETCKAS